MLKLYKQIDGRLHYWETWENDNKTAIIHWGPVGERGAHKEVKSGFISSFTKAVEKEIAARLAEGYAEIDDEDHAFLEIEFKVEGFGTEDDLDKRHELENHLDQLLGWTGLGAVNGGSIGSGTMEVGCAVVDYEIAKSVIEQDLKDGPYADYHRIFRME